MIGGIFPDAVYSPKTPPLWMPESSSMAGRKLLDGWEPTDRDRRMVRVMAAYTTQVEICGALGIDRKTLLKHFPDEMDQKDLATAEVALSLYEKATDQKCSGPAVAAASFWLRTAGRWKIHQDHAADQAAIGTVNAPLLQQNTQINIQVEDLSAEELRAITNIAGRLSPARGSG